MSKSTQQTMSPILERTMPRCILWRHVVLEAGRKEHETKKHTRHVMLCDDMKFEFLSIFCTTT